MEALLVRRPAAPRQTRGRRLLWTAVAGLALAAGLRAAEAKKDEIEPSVTYAKSWAAAVEEAQLLNVPIVVHSHGFY